MNKKPNVVLIFVDDLGYGDIACFNPDGKIQTTNIDALAAGGMKFTDSHSASPICSPSRYALLTGRYNFRSRLKYMVLPGDSGPLIEKDRKTLGHFFQENGYRTACVGKWHLGMEWATKESYGPEDYPEIDPSHYENIRPRKSFFPTLDNFTDIAEGLDVDYTQPIIHGPNEFGFDYYFGMVASLDQPPYVYVENNKLTEPLTHWIGRPEFNRHALEENTKWQYGLAGDSFDHNNVADDMNHKVLELIEDYAKQDDPFFIYYPTPLVHTPLIPGEAFRGKSGLGNYGDWVLHLDHLVGEITNKLKETNQLEDTILIFTSDNGCSRAADFDSLMEKGHNPSYIFRGHKGDMYEGGHRLPTIVHYPKEIAPNTQSDANICHTDFYATFADPLGVTLPDDVAEDSFSNLDIWRGGDKCDRIATVCTSAMGYLGIVRGGYKLCCTEGGRGKEYVNAIKEKTYFPIQYELYNLYEDIAEEHNIIDERPEIAAQLKRELHRVLDQGRSTQGKPQQNYIPDTPWVQTNF